MSRGSELTRAAVSRVLDGVREQAQRLLQTVGFGRSLSQRPLPRVRIRLGARVPGAVFQLVVAAVALGSAWLVVTGPVSTFFAVAGAVLVLARPSGIACAGYAVGLGFLLAVSSSEPFAPRSFLLLFGVHLLVQLGAVASSVGWSAVLDLRVLVSPLRRFVVVQALAQLLALGGAALASASVTLPWVPVLVGVALTALAWMILSRLTERGMGPRP